MSQANKSQSASNNMAAPATTAAASSTPTSAAAPNAGASKLSHPAHPALPIPHSSPRTHAAAHDPHSSPANDVVNAIAASTAFLALSASTTSPVGSANSAASSQQQMSPDISPGPNSAPSSTASTASTTPSSASASSTPASNVSVSTASSKSLHTHNSENALWVGDLDPSLDDHTLVAVLFSAVSSPIIHSKIIRDKVSGLSRGYGFIEFADRMEAERVMREYNGKEIDGSQGKRKYKLNWASGGEQERKANAASASSSPSSSSPSAGHHGNADDNAIAIFIGDLSSDVNDQLLEAVFRQRYASVVNGRVVMDGVTNKSKGFGFVRFRDENEARHAIETMQGTVIGSRAIRLSNATPKRNQQSSAMHAHPAAGRLSVPPHGNAHLPHHPNQLINHTRGIMMNAGGVAVIHDPENANNNTVFVGGLDESTTSDHIRDAFSSFGIILNITIPLNKGCAFVEYDNHIAAANAIAALHQTKVGSSIIRCTWGKRNAKRGNNAHGANPSGPNANGPQGGAPSAGGNFGVFPYSHPNLLGPSAAAAAYGYDAFNTFNAYPAYAAAAAAYPSYEYLNGQNHNQANQADSANAAAAAAFYPPFAAAASAAYDPNQYNLHFPHASFAGYGAPNASGEVNQQFNNANTGGDGAHGNGGFPPAANVSALNERKDSEGVRQPARLVDVRAKDQIINPHHNAHRPWQQHPRQHHQQNTNAHAHAHPRQHQQQQHGHNAFRGYNHPNASSHEGTISA